MNTETIRDYLGDFANELTEDQISIITAAAIDVEERIIAKYGDMTLEERDGYASGIGWMGERLDGPRVGIAAS